MFDFFTSSVLFICKIDSIEILEYLLKSHNCGESAFCWTLSPALSLLLSTVSVANSVSMFVQSVCVLSSILGVCFFCFCRFLLLIPFEEYVEFLSEQTN